MASYVTDQSGVNPNGSSSSSSSTSDSTTKGKGEVAPPKLLRLQSAADYTVDESFAVDTRDHEDHTFCGIMFDLIVKDLLPVQYLEVDKIWVRGGLGNLTVWMIEGTHEKRFDKKDLWTQIYKGTHEPADELIPLVLENPLSLPVGQRIGLYIHSTRQDGQAIVYDNERNKVSHEDNYITITSGCAHISPRPFDSRGFWGWAWRPRREFVGRLSYGVKFLMWKPTAKVTNKFPTQYKRCALTLLASLRRDECPLNVLPTEIMFYIINMCSWNWFGGVEEHIEEKKLRLGYGTNSANQYNNNRGSTGEGIGWRSRGMDYRRLIHQHMMQSETGQRYVSNQYDDDGDQEEEEEEEEEAEDEEYVMEEDDDYYVQESSDDDEDGVEEQSNLSRFLQYVVQRATGGDGNNQQQAEGGLTPEQIQGLLERIVAASEEEEATTTTTTNMELNEDDVEEVVEE